MYNESPLLFIKERYRDFLNKQIIINEGIKNKKYEVEEVISKVKSNPQQLQRKAYDAVLDHIERLNDETNAITIIMDELIPQIINNINLHRIGLNEIKSVFDDFTKFSNNVKIATLEDLARETVFKYYSKEQIETLPEHIKSVLCAGIKMEI